MLSIRRFAGAVLLVAATAVLVAGCGGGGGGGGAEGTPVDVSLADFVIEPQEIKAPAGTITLVLKNNGAQPHDLRVDGLAKPTESSLLTPGESGKLTFTAEKGTYDVYCSVAGHKESGMVATLVVE